MTFNLKINLRSISIVIMVILLGALMVTPVEGSNNTSSGMITACVGNTAGSGSVKISSRTITGTNVLQYAPGGVCPASETSLNLPSYVHTVLVSPIPGGTAVQNGAALLSAMTTITTATSINPWLLKIEPGLYNLNGGVLAMKSYVDLEGSGEDTTVISSSIGYNTGSLITLATITGASNSEARFLTVINSGTGQYDHNVALYIPVGVTDQFNYLSARASGGSYSSAGIVNQGGTLILKNNTINASGGLNNSSIINDTGTITVENSIITASGGSSNNDSFASTDGITTILNSNLTASGGSTGCGIRKIRGTLTVENSNLAIYGNSAGDGIISEEQGNATVRNNTITVSGSQNNHGFYNSGLSISSVATMTIQSSNVIISGGMGLFNDYGTATVQNSTFSVNGTSQNSGISNFANGTTIVQNSTLTVSGGIANYGISNANGGKISVGTSQLAGSPPTNGTGSIICTGVYNQSFTALDATCQ